MTDAQLVLAQQSRQDRLLDDAIDNFLDKHLPVMLSEADTVGPDARHKLRGILKHYAKEPHPFRACVRDNMKRFGPGRTEKVCATLKDIIRGTTKWRGHPGADHGAPGAVAASDSSVLPPEIDEGVEMLLLAIPDDALEAFVFEAQEVAHAT